MNYLIYLLSILFIQKSTAQIFTVAGKNCIPNLYNPNIGSNIPLASGLGLSNGIALANIGQTGNIELANIPRNAATGNIANTNLENFYIPNPSSNQAFINGNTLGNVANANIGLTKSATNFANIGLANNVGSNVANIGLNNNAKVVNVDNSNANAPCNSANNPISKYANVVQPPRDYGIEFGADALEVNGAVQVSGRMPFNAKVAVQGSMPAQGKGTVSYTCDKVDES